MLQWLPVQYRSDFKPLLVTLKASTWPCSCLHHRFTCALCAEPQPSIPTKGSWSFSVTFFISHSFLGWLFLLSISVVGLASVLLDLLLFHMVLLYIYTHIYTYISFIVIL